MLKPFRIRNLYFNSSELVDASGVVQISSQQYDAEIQAIPEAVFAYLDDDDGETVTVSLSVHAYPRRALTSCPGRIIIGTGATTFRTTRKIFQLERPTVD
jgi:hypothetical protein